MKKTLLYLSFTIFLFTSCATAQVLSPVVKLEGTLNEDTLAFFAGKTSVSGIFNGYDIDFIINNPLFEDIDGFPLLGTNKIINIDKVILIDINSINITSLSDFTNIDDLKTFEFSNVDIIAEEGPFLLATNQGEIRIGSTLPFAISSIIGLNVEDIGYIKFLIVGSTSKIDINYLGDSAYLIQNSNTSKITIKDSEGNNVWDGNSEDFIFIIEDKDFTINQYSSIHLFPLLTNNTFESIKLSVSYANFDYDMLSDLFYDISNSNIEYIGISDISDKIEEFESIISPLSSVINGCMILVDTNETFIIDDTVQSFSKVGFARANYYDVTFSSKTQTPQISGDYKLIFLGDHLFSTQAKNSDDGVALPIIFIIIWAISIILIILFKFYIEKLKPFFYKKEVDDIMDNKIKIFAIIFHIVALIIAFILMDREISFQFGVSAIDTIFGQGFSVILLAFIVVELVIWVLGYFILAMPIRIITNSILRIFGFGKGGKGIGKGVGAFGIWIFCAFYVKLIINIIFFFINPESFFPV